MTDSKKPTANTSNDPYIYASILGSYVEDRNPLQIIVGDIQRMVNVVVNIGKTRKAAQMKIDQIQAQVTRMESHMAEVHPKTTGHRIDKLR